MRGCVMRGIGRAWVCVLCCAVGAWGLVATTAATAADTTGAPKSSAPRAPSRVPGAAGTLGPRFRGAPSPLSGAMVIPGVPVSSEQVQAQEQARRLTPAAIAAREASQTAYEHLGTAQARALAQRVFPRLVEEPAGGPPALPAGAKIAKIPADNVAQLTLADGKHAVIESLQPIALETAPGHHAPIDLHLRESGGAFQPTLSPVRLRIPKRLREGIDLGRAGVSLTPVTANDSPLSGSSGEVQGATVSYTNTMTDADTLIKPTTIGFSAETLLRAADSPRGLYYRVGLPVGARLVATNAGAGSNSLAGAGGTGGVRVVDDGETIAKISAPSAQDAEGTPVPVTMKISGNMLALTVAPFAGRYTLPIVVDPEVEGGLWLSEARIDYYTEWHFEHYGAGFGAPESPEGTTGNGQGSWTENIYSGHNPGEWGGLFYTTRGASEIVFSHVESHWNDTGSHIENYVILLATSKAHSPEESYIQDYDNMQQEETGGWGGYACAPARECPNSTAGKAPMENNNTAGYMQYATGNGEGHGGENTVTSAATEILQEKGPEIEFNKSSETIYNKATGEYVPNVLYSGHETWLGPHHGAFEVRAKDPGIGLSFYAVRPEAYGFHWYDEKNYYRDQPPKAEGAWCYGVQCPESNNQAYTYPGGIPEGDTGVSGEAEDAAGLEAKTHSQVVKVDATPPQKIKIVGLRNGNELPIGESHLEVEAADGEGTTKSSGVQSINVRVEGQGVAGTAASCPEGPCTASTKFTLSSRDYTPGTHSLIVTATDNAGNVAQEEFTFRVRGTNPVSIGPGSVEPSSGQFSLGATDVSLSGVTKVSRTYRSRSLTAGATGPLGPQWAINLGGGEGLTVQPGGAAVLSSSDGGLTTFTPNSKGELEPPKGDSNLALENKTAEHKYLLKDATAGSETVYEQPSSTQTTPPVFSESFGSEPGGLKRPVSDALDASGDLWVTDWTGDRLAKFSPSGALLAEYGSEGSAGGQFSNPWGVAINQSTGNVYVTEYSNDRIDQFSSSGAFVKAIGWGVTDGKAEKEICTTTCKAGIAGSGNGQFSGPAGVYVDSSGNIWVADYNDDRVQEFNEKGEFQRTFGSEGSGGGQFKNPVNITFSGGNVYVADQTNNRIQEFTTAGVFVKAIGWGVSDGKSEAEVCTSGCKAGIAGSGNGQFNLPRGLTTDPVSGNLYVTEIGGNRVQETTAAGAFVTKFGSAGLWSGAVRPADGRYRLLDGRHICDGLRTRPGAGVVAADVVADERQKRRNNRLDLPL